MNRQAMIELRRVVENCPADLLHMREMTERSECGTAHCAFGWAKEDRWFHLNTDIRLACTGNMFPMAADILGISRDHTTILLGGLLSRANKPHDVSKEEVLANIDRMLDGLEPHHYRAVHPSDYSGEDGYLDLNYEKKRRG